MAQRIFLAIECSGAIRKSASGVIRRLAAASDAAVKWVAPESLHLTLKFFGTLDDREGYLIAKAVAPLARQLAAWELEVGGVGAFPTIQRPRTLWLGIRAGGEALVDLADRVEHALAPLGYPRERRRFHPHFTLGRVRGGRSPAGLTAELEDLAELQVGSLSVDELTLFSSQLRREGPMYTALSRHPFEG